MTAGHAGTCPSCGAPLTFEVGSSHASVCRFCNALVARQGQGFALLGKVADLTPTGSRIAMGARGTYLGEAFTVVGRVQLAWKQGVWDEWYVSFPDERWGWLAEAQGRYYVTFPMSPRGLPAASVLKPGFALEIAGHGRFVVTDIKDARLVSAAGELPAAVSLEGTSHSVDLEGTQGTFATLDYGSGDGDGGAPDLFVGRQRTLDELQLHGGEAALSGGAPVPEGEALVCKSCGAPVTIRVPGQTVRLVCASCNALLDASEGALQLVTVLKRHKEEPPIPLGTKGKLRGLDVLVVGWMKRGCSVSGVHYGWEELLLYEPKSTALSWLVVADGHWSSARAIPAAEVQEHGGTADYRDKSYKRFSVVRGKVERVLGEFAWQVTVGESAQLEDYVAPPEGLSSERTGAELNWSLIEHLEPSEVARAFGLDDLRREARIGVGAVQPWFLEAAIKPVGRWLAGGVAAALLITLVQSGGESRVLSHTFMAADVAEPEPPPEGEAPQPPDTLVRSFLSEPFELHGHRALEARVTSNVDNAWAWVEGAIINDATEDASLFGLETSYYHGVEDGESWSEGSLSADQAFSAPPRGTYVLRADLQWDPRIPPPKVTVELREGGWSGWQLLAVLSVLLSPLLLLFHRRKFEQRRWEESNLRHEEE